MEIIDLIVLSNSQDQFLVLYITTLSLTHIMCFLTIFNILSPIRRRLRDWDSLKHVFPGTIFKHANCAQHYYFLPLNNKKRHYLIISNYMYIRGVSGPNLSLRTKRAIGTTRPIPPNRRSCGVMVWCSPLSDVFRLTKTVPRGGCL